LSIACAGEGRVGGVEGDVGVIGKEGEGEGGELGGGFGDGRGVREKGAAHMSLITQAWSLYDGIEGVGYNDEFKRSLVRRVYVVWCSLCERV
jgi:hypothetical protein